MDSIDLACGERLLYEIPTIKPDFVYRAYKNRVRAIGMWPWNLSIKLLGVPTYRSIMRTDLSLVFDAVLFDRSLYNPAFNYLSSLYLLLPHARKAGKRVAWFNVTAGPVTTPMGKRMVRELAEITEFITVRDQSSLDILRELGVQQQNIFVTADAALNTQPASDERVAEIWKTLGFAPGEEVLAINVNKYRDTWAGLNRAPTPEDEFIRVYAEACSELSKKLDLPLLFVCTQHHDVPLTKAIIQRINSGKKISLVTNIDYGHEDLKGVLSQVSLLIAMRLHCNILGTSALTPALALQFAPKVKHYYDSLGLPQNCVSFEKFSVSLLVENGLRAWSERHETRKTLERRIPELQRDAHKSGQIVALLRQGLSAEQAIAAITVKAPATEQHPLI